MRRLPRARHRKSQAQALVEFALVIPVFLVLVCAIFDVGSAVVSYTSTTNAAREGARLAIVNQDVTTIKNRALDQAILSGKSSPIVDVKFYQPMADGTPDKTDQCPSPVAAGCLAVITYQATYTPITPVIAQVLFPSGVTFTAETVVRIESSCPDGARWPTAADCPKQP